MSQLSFPASNDCLQASRPTVIAPRCPRGPRPADVAVVGDLSARRTDTMAAPQQDEAGFTGPLPRDVDVYREPEPAEAVAENFPPLTNDRLLRALRRQPVDRVPVWVMRQAGRYLPEYHVASDGRSFFEKCRNPAVCAQLTLQPLIRYPLDAAIIFSDILVVLQAMGLECVMQPGK